MSKLKIAVGSFLAALAWVSGTVAAQAENWPQWRGPFYNGSTTEKGLPATFSKTENVLWVADLPGSSAATPIIWGEHVFISSLDNQTKALVAVCIQHSTGRPLWTNEVASESATRDRMSNYASSSPVTDGRVVVFFYGNGDMAAFDFAGKKVWSKNIQKDYGQFAFLYNFSSSPTLFDNKLYLQVLQRNVPVNGRGQKDGPNDSYLLAMDPQTGKELWRHIRPSPAQEESLEAYSTPIPYTENDRSELMVAGGDVITGHDPKTGNELWRWGKWNPTRIGHWRLVPSPVAGRGVVLVCAPKQAPVYALKTGQTGNLDVTALAWKSQERAVSSDVSTPLFYKGRFYVLNSDRKLLSSVEPATGKVFWTGDLQSTAKIEASPTGADDKIYMVNFKGEVFVVGTGDEFKLLHKAPLGSETDFRIRATIAVAQRHLFVRTESKLYCIGAK